MFSKMQFKFGEAVSYEILADIKQKLDEPPLIEMQWYLSLIKEVTFVPKGFSNYFHLSLHPVFSVQIEARVAKKLEILKL